jgi:type II secretory pathway component GspD/PulD (secretin)
VAQDGQIVALGGLMRHAQKEDRSQVPLLGDAPSSAQLPQHGKLGSEKTRVGGRL